MATFTSRPMDGRRLAAFLFFLISVLVLLIRPVYTSGIVLNEFVRHFEPLFYDHDDLRVQHSRSKRESPSLAHHAPSAQLRLQFHAHNRLFKIRLRRSASEVFADDVVFESTQGPIDYETDRIYEGELEDDDQSSVSAVLSLTGHLDATVSTASETYYVEPSSRYFDSNSTRFPAVIYKASDVVHPDQPDCASHHFYLKHFEEQQQQQQHEHCANRPFSSCSNQSSVIIASRHHDNAAAKSAATATSLERQLIDRTLYSGWDRRQHKSKAAKKKRSSNTIDPRKTTCMLYLQADHLFYAKMGSEEACIEAMTRHVQRVNSIYKNIDFDGDGQPDEINFMIKRIKVHTEQALNEASYRFPGNYGVEKFLELFSEEDYNAFCLAYMFTYRDFEGGTLGLAWTGDLKNAGGVCEKNGHYRGSLKSLNTGIVTLLNYGKHVPPAVSHVTLAHEIGHNFGSPHDPENNRDCTPGGEDGNYIMFARATSGDKKNNNKFSPCSLKSINGVLSSKARNDQGCFTEPQSAICGNGVVEAGEECDCGWEEDCQEKCCYPMRSTQQPGEKPCTLRPGRKCSPSQGPCCTEDCQLRYGIKCRDDNGCRDAAYCDGTGPRCPLSNNKPNKTVCNEEFVCFMGECTGSICIAYGLQSCQCLQGPNDPPTKACELCCKLPGDDQPCLSSFEWNTAPYDVPDAHAKAGTPCNNYNGYCDVFQRCREVDPSGPLATLRRLLLSDESIASLKKWIEDHWYGVLFIAVGFITVIVVIARVFGKRVQKLRQVARQQRTSRTTNGLINAAAAAATAAALDESQNQHIVHPVAVRTKIPLKRKVREKEKRAGRKAHASPSIKALALLRGRPTRQQTNRDRPADRTRQRRSGVVSTKEKVRSWLERENPTREIVDSDNESQFPEEEKQAGQEASQTDTRRHSIDAKLSAALTAELADCSGNSSQPNLTVAAQSIPNPIPPATRPAGKMMRSISETTRPRDLQVPSQHRHNFSRSISHTQPPDFRGLNRKTESHSHLLSKSELEIDFLKPHADAKKPEDTRVSAVKTSVHHVPKSATESHLVKMASGGQERTGIRKRLSADFLNLLLNRKASASVPSGEAAKKRSRPDDEAAVGDGGKVRKKIGLGPVKVVLKWHGGGQRSSSSRPKRSGKEAEERNKKKKKAKTKPKSKNKRVIVYKNGNPTAAPPPPIRTEVVDCTPPIKKDHIHITVNPLEATVTDSAAVKQHPSPVRADNKAPASADAVFRARRYSMQERQPAPTLMRRVSEVQHPTSTYLMNQRRNRHSWTPSACAAAPHPPAASGQIAIDLDLADDEDGSQ